MTLSKRDQDRLVSRHYEYARKKASIFHRTHTHLEREDLTQEAALACMSAAKTFDPNFGTTFLTYATPFIEKALLFYARTQRRESERVKKAGEFPVEEPQESPESRIDRERTEAKIPRQEYLGRFLMGHSMTDMAAAEAVAPSTIFRRIHKEADAISAVK